MKQVWECQPRPSKSASASLTIAWIFSAVMPGGRAGSEKSTVAGSKPIKRPRFIHPSLPQPLHVLAAVSPVRCKSRGHHVPIFRTLGDVQSTIHEGGRLCGRFHDARLFEKG